MWNFPHYSGVRGLEKSHFPQKKYGLKLPKYSFNPIPLALVHKCNQAFFKTCLTPKIK